jgi:hypothetical protein
MFTKANVTRLAGHLIWDQVSMSAPAWRAWPVRNWTAAPLTADHLGDLTDHLGELAVG